MVLARDVVSWKTLVVIRIMSDIETDPNARRVDLLKLLVYRNQTSQQKFHGSLTLLEE